MYLYIFPSRDYAVGSVSGVLASFVAVLSAHPIESVKVRMQTAQHLQSDASGQGFVGGLRALLRNPYAGVGPHLLQYALLNSVRFGSYAYAQAYFQRQAEQRRRAEESDGSWARPLGEAFACGAFSGLCVAASLHPLFVVKTHQQVNRLGVLEAASKLWQGEGLQGLYRTYLAGFVRFPFALGVFFSSYEALKRFVVFPASSEKTEVQQGAVSNYAQRAAFGAIAGMLCWTSVFPLDVVQSRVIGEAKYGPARQYPGAISAFRTLYRQEGLSAFSRGYSAVLIRAGPVNAVLLPVNDALKPLAERLLPQA